MSWREVIQKTTEIRHWLHQHPELTWQETHTAEKIRHWLSNLNIPWQAYASHGTVARFNQDAIGKHIAFRADMDALPIHEDNQLSFCSTHPGKMHACGHDGHMAALLGFAMWLKENEQHLTQPVSLVFQPAEEGGHGAKKMIEDGALSGIDEIYGWHNWPALPLGKALCPNGSVMSGNGTFHLLIKGKGGHASQPEATQDPVLAAAAITLNLQQIVSRRLPPQAAVVVSVTTLIADSDVTITPETVRLEGSIRLSDPQYRQTINQLIAEIAQHTAQSYGVEAEVDIRPRYEATINHPQAAQAYRTALKNVLGESSAQSDLLLPLMASEDFSYYLQEIPGAFALIGMSENDPQQQNYHSPCHSPNYQFNDKLLETVIRVFSQLTGIPISHNPSN